MKKKEEYEYYTEDLPNEIWKEIEKYPGYYVSTMGRVRNKYNKFMGTNMSNGYKCVGLSTNKKRYGYYIHRLVAEAFIPNPENKRTINHINGIKDDNRLINIEWATDSENVQHSFDIGLSPKGEDHGISKLMNIDIPEIRILLKSKMKQKDIAKIYDVCQMSISKINTGETWSHIK